MSGATLNLYPSIGGYICRLSCDDKLISAIQDKREDDNHRAPAKDIPFVVVMDQSGSMGGNVKKLITKFLPNLFDGLKYSGETEIPVITFECNTVTRLFKIGHLPNQTLGCLGSTNMAPVMDHLSKIFEKFDPNQAVRLLVISDGDVFDQEQTVTKASELLEEIANRKLYINSQAIRLFTSSWGQPDTRAVSSLLQFSSKNPVLVDIAAEDPVERQVEKVLHLFRNDGFNELSNLRFADNSPILQNQPWDPVTDSLRISPRDKDITFWMATPPPAGTQLLLDDQFPVDLIIHEELDEAHYIEIFKNRINTFLTQMKIFKIVGTASSSTRVQRMAKYFADLEKTIKYSTDTIDMVALAKDRSLQGRVKYLRAAVHNKEKMFALRMSEIANDDRVAGLNAAQSADYLRTVSASKSGRSLAKRAGTSGLDFEEQVEAEIKKMRDNLSDLDGVDDSDHPTSFISLSTTLEGIRTVCSLLDEVPEGGSIYDTFSLKDVLELFSIVGIPVSGPVGDFVDPYTYHITDIFPGHYCSVADIFTSYGMDSEAQVFVPVTQASSGDRKPITNVIPDFSCEKIRRFLTGYAPTTLSYIASIGMRRVVLDIPFTYNATLVAGIMKLINTLQVQKSEVCAKALISSSEVVSKLYKGLVINEFSSIEGISKANIYSLEAHDQTMRMVFAQYLDLVKKWIPAAATPEEEANKVAHWKKVNRTFYVTEVYRTLRRVVRKSDDHIKATKEFLNELLDVSASKLPALTPLYEADRPWSELGVAIPYTVKPESYEKFYKMVKFLDGIAAYKNIFSDVFKADIDSLKSIPAMTEESFAENFDLPAGMDAALYRYLVIVQSLLMDDKKSRVNEEHSIVFDVVNVDKYTGEAFNTNINTLIAKYLDEEYKSLYEKALGQKKIDESRQFIEDLLVRIATSSTDEDIDDAFLNGVTRFSKTYQLTVPSASTFPHVYKLLCDETDERVVNRKQKIERLVLGVNPAGQKVFNNGNPLDSAYLPKLARIFTISNDRSSWLAILAKYEESRKNYTYRPELDNRHGHSNNKRSYWAMGYDTISDMANKVTSDDFKSYSQEHAECCGFATHEMKVAAKRAKKQRLA